MIIINKIYSAIANIDLDSKGHLIINLTKRMKTKPVSILIVLIEKLLKEYKTDLILTIKKKLSIYKLMKILNHILNMLLRFKIKDSFKLRKKHLNPTKSSKSNIFYVPIVIIL